MDGSRNPVKVVDHVLSYPESGDGRRWHPATRRLVSFLDCAESFVHLRESRVDLLRLPVFLPDSFVRPFDLVRDFVLVPRAAAVRLLLLVTDRLTLVLFVVDECPDTGSPVCGPRVPETVSETYLQTLCPEGPVHQTHLLGSDPVSVLRPFPPVVPSPTSRPPL